MKQYFDVQEVAIIAGIHKNTVRKYIKDGRLKAHRKINQRRIPWLVNSEDLAEFLLEQQEQKGMINRWV